ncbi:MAG: hypothetical protein WCD45_03645 [Gallionella sp.]
MATLTMDMSSGVCDSNKPAAEYEEEILNAGWNPQLALQQYASSEHHDIPHHLVNVSVDVFLKRMYANQR